MQADVPPANHFQQLARLARLDFQAACRLAVEILTPLPLTYCRILDYGSRHQARTVAQSGIASGEVQLLSSFAGGMARLEGIPTAQRLDSNTRDVLEAISAILTSAWKQQQTGRRLLTHSQLALKQRKVLQGLKMLSEQADETDDLRTFYDKLHQVLRQMMYAENLLVAIADRQQGLFTFAYAVDSSLGDTFIEGESFALQDMSASLTSYVFRHGQPKLFFKRALERMRQQGRVQLRGELPISWLGVPFRIDETRDGIMILQTYDGEPVYQDADRKLLSSVSRFIAIANRRHFTASRLNHQAQHDQLTGLANRQFFTERLQRQLDQHNCACVMFIDLDDFKQLNDRHGHSAGDHCLVTLASRLEALLGDGEFAGRLGGDEFAVMLPQGNRQRTEQLADALVTELTRPMTWQHQILSGHISIGLSCARQDGQISAEALLNKADHAMYRAKASKGSAWHWYDAALNAEIERRLQILRELEQALADDALTLYYQPIIAAASGQVMGFEVLLRWFRADGTMIGPAEFIPLAEQSGLILRLDHWVLEQAARQIKQWRRGDDALYLTVNISGRQLTEPGFASQIQALLDRHGLPGNSLVLEMTEHVMVDNFDSAREQIQRLNRLGVGLALDDFGTGFSSLSYLNSLPFDLLKLDRAFISGLPDDIKSTQIVSHVTSLSHAFGIKVVAEGVETAEQQACLEALGCDRLQGYYIARPMPKSEAEAFMGAAEARVA